MVELAGMKLGIVVGNRLVRDLVHGQHRPVPKEHPKPPETSWPASSELHCLSCRLVTAKTRRWQPFLL
ncbi:hypothetical protein LINJ_19_0830 [Leishmania infantum JPCM5]|uniref:Uncharacterized protein n=3 Tax=Leishmania donovani species complex TaxID=38574 RepID=A4HYA7_LEIIN|nr:hypothetical protein LINJ_19_0830 [Leishmania infantum JPCM5]CAC9482995.1 hypothetical_protein [Leishmania infantum]CAM67291.1 hypothetical protein LINJ_19_0830 [Leishmania infantum JPCM5]SUZ41185.1 hypothetical_protein [Leishmania infantum]|eukprot:XP_001465048.1 hypothetical protein LINJ_19_0830 [Leishmania infantum JPCM5]